MRFNVGMPVEKMSASLKAMVEAAAAALRAEHITPGKDLVYLHKDAEARRVVSGEPYRKAEVPFVAAEATASGSTMDEAARTIISRSDETRAALAKIEAQERKAKLAIDQAGSILDARRIADRAFKRR